MAVDVVVIGLNADSGLNADTDELMQMCCETVITRYLQSINTGGHMRYSLLFE